MTTYTIKVFNQSGQTKSYVLFMGPVGASPGGTTPVHANAWATLENLTNGGWDSAAYTPEDAVQGRTPKAPPAPRVLVAEGSYTPGQVLAPPKGANVATIDFTGRSQTTATATEHPDGSFAVAYG